MPEKKKLPLLPAGIACMCGGVVVYLPSLIAAMWLIFSVKAAEQRIGIIGGADEPTVQMLLYGLFRHPAFWLTSLGGLIGSAAFHIGLMLVIAEIISRHADKHAKKTP